MACYRLAGIALAALMIATLAGCSDDEACAPSCTEDDDAAGTGGSAGASGSGGSASCTDTTGELHGRVSLFAAPGSPDSLPAPNALLDLQQDPADTPIHAMADDQSTFSVELPPGSWIVGGTSEDGYCKTFMPKTAVVEACGTTELDVVLESCVN